MKTLFEKNELFNYLFPVLIITLATIKGYAADSCKTLPECLQLKSQLTDTLVAVEKRRKELQQLQPSPQLGDIARGTDGSPLYLSLQDAMNYCEDRGQRLPSARELAQFATRMGADGISETSKNGYYKVSALNADGKKDIFYFSHEGYTPPRGFGFSSQPSSLWSSSVHENARTYHAVGMTGIGEIFDKFLQHADNLLVRCVHRQ